VSDALGTPAVLRAARRAWAEHLGAPAPERLRDELVEGSIAVAAHETALRVPDQPALEIDGAGLTHGQLDERAARMAGWLRERGVSAEDVVLISAPSSLALVIAYLGSLRLGATVLLANPAYTEAELEHLIGDSGAVLAMAAGPGLARLRSVALRDGGHPEVVDLEALAGSSNELIGVPAVDPADPEPERAAILAYTSGTTGKPKAVPLTDGNVLSSIRAVMLAWHWRPDDVLVHALPLFHQHGLGGIHATLLAGSRAVIHSRFDPARLCDAIERTPATVLFAVPSIYGRLAEWEGAASAELSSLRLLVSGSAPLSPPLAERLAELAGQLPLERYGTTESGLDVSNPYSGTRRPGMVGLALPGIESAIADQDGKLVDPGNDGEIVVRGPQVFAGYRGLPGATAEAFYAGGWFRTGDVGRVDPDNGYLRITGRLRELIISGGMNVYPREVEFALESHPTVARAAVVGVPSMRWGEEVVAAVVPAARSEPPRDADLIQFARSRLAPYKCPKRVLVVTELPVNAMGKIVAAEVRKLF
jgi:malonyl-CoA/methylmalonyl-CoA synthetase